MEDEADLFLNSVVGKLTVIARERRGKRWAYSCLCQCGAVTLPRRADYIRRRGDLAACKNCSVGAPRPEVPKRPEPVHPERQRFLPSGHAIWRIRSRRLADAIIEPLSMAAVILLAKERFWWTPDLTREVLAAADGTELVRVSGLWCRPDFPKQRVYG